MRKFKETLKERIETGGGNETMETQEVPTSRSGIEDVIIVTREELQNMRKETSENLGVTYYYPREESGAYIYDEGTGTLGRIIQKDAIGPAHPRYDKENPLNNISIITAPIPPCIRNKIED
jgi:hypothetical protein